MKDLTTSTVMHWIVVMPLNAVKPPLNMKMDLLEVPTLQKETKRGRAKEKRTEILLLTP